MINVTKSSLPSYNKYCLKIKELWETGHLTDNGKFLKELELKMKKHLGVNYLSLLANGTLALQIALELFRFGVGDEIITTPFSYIATSSAILWQKFKPVFVDIDEDTFNIDPEMIEEKITNKTKAILAVHVFGNPCEVERIDEIAKKNNLKVIYDASHCFGVEYNNESLLNYGDCSTLSFQATKVFQTIEGGAVVTSDEKLINLSDQMRYFGFKHDKSDVDTMGINAKMNEFQAAMGLLNLEEIDNWIDSRKMLFELYLQNFDGIEDVKFQKLNPNLTRYNFTYFPILFKSKKIRDHVYDKLKENEINARKYFYPLIMDFSKYSTEFTFKKAAETADSILCLPLYPYLTSINVNKICSIITKIL